MALEIERKQPAGMNVRMQQGKPAYSHVVTVNGPGKTIYFAGQLARDEGGNLVGKGDMRAQMEQTFKNLDSCLKAAGASWAPSIASVPDVGCARPSKHFIVVDFPDPLGPRRPQIEPGSTSSVRPETASKVP